MIEKVVARVVIRCQKTLSRHDNVNGNDRGNDNDNDDDNCNDI